MSGTVLFDEDNASQTTLSRFEGLEIQNLEHKLVVDALPPGILSGSSLTFSYPVKGEDTLTVGNQAFWIRVKGLLAASARLSGQHYLEAVSNYNAMLTATTFSGIEGEFFPQQIENFLEETGQVVTEPAREKLRSIANREMAREAEKILDELCNALHRIDTSGLPPVRVFEVEDGSLLIEWILSHHRIGFSIEPDREDSGWFLVSDSSAQGINAWGFLSGENIEWLVNWLLKPITDYYL